MESWHWWRSNSYRSCGNGLNGSAEAGQLERAARLNFALLVRRRQWQAQLPLRSTSMIWESGDRKSAKSVSLATAEISWLLDRQAPRHRRWRTARLGRYAGSRTILPRDAVELGRQRGLPVRRRDAEHFLQPG